MTAIGLPLELYYIDGRPDGMLTAEMFNWTGHVLMAPRTQLSAALARSEACNAGVYLLFGEREGEPLAYIGEGEDISARIRTHDVNKDWWTTAILVTAAGNKLNKAHVRYLEARLIEEARKVGRMPLDNGINPSRPSLSEADIAKMEAFLKNLLFVLPAVRVDMFIQRARADAKTGAATGAAETKSASTEAVQFFLESKKHSLKASALLKDGEFIVEAGSQARSDWEGVPTHSYDQLYEELRRAGVLRQQQGRCEFTENYAFKSPSAAAAVINGRAANGTVEWHTADGLTYKAWEAAQLGNASGIAA